MALRVSSTARTGQLCLVLLFALFMTVSCSIAINDDDETNYVNLLLRDLDNSGLQDQAPTDRVLDGKDIVKRHWGVSDATAVAGKVFSYPIPEDAFTGRIKRYEVSACWSYSTVAELSLCLGCDNDLTPCILESLECSP
ncbi:alpha-dystroglycan [Caerostris darwini]|uniref:Alpha-dystroglycan n=1 Tax=Caerostris darwini TaxID=1538125 RepID=A0AAV4NKC8_9ARAC|nr:alpha-dystroglycan [Caerostris darwini]